MSPTQEQKMRSISKRKDFSPIFVFVLLKWIKSGKELMDGKKEQTREQTAGEVD